MKCSSVQSLGSEYREILYRCSLFKDFDKERADGLIDKLGGLVCTYEKKEAVISELDLVDRIGVLLTGALGEVQYNIDGTELFMHKIKPTYLVGLEIAVSEKQTSPYSIYAMERSEVFYFSKDVLISGDFSVEDKNLLHEKVFHYLASSNIRQFKRIEILSCKGARERIIKYLEKQSYRYESKEFDIDFNREQLANFLGLNRSVLSHELKRMEKEGILSVRRNHFCLYGETFSE